MIIQSRPVSKAKPKTDSGTIAVYNAKGELVGTCAADAITRLGSVEPGPQQQSAPVAQAGQAAQQTADATSADVEKALRRLPRPQAQRIVKAAVDEGGDVAKRYEKLLAGLPTSMASSIRSSTAVRATSLAVSYGVAGPEALRVVQSAVLRGAQRAGR